MITPTVFARITAMPVMKTTMPKICIPSMDNQWPTMRFLILKTCERK
jgi:hypothetical protein